MWYMRTSFLGVLSGSSVTYNGHKLWTVRNYPGMHRVPRGRFLTRPIALRRRKFVLQRQGLRCTSSGEEWNGWNSQCETLGEGEYMVPIHRNVCSSSALWIPLGFIFRILVETAFYIVVFRLSWTFRAKAKRDGGKFLEVVPLSRCNSSVRLGIRTAVCARKKKQ